MPGPAVPGPAVPGPPVPAPPPVPGPPPRSAAVTALGAPGRPSGSAAVTAPESESPRPSTDNGGQRPSRGGPPRRAGSGPGGEDREAERGLRGLVGSGSSQVSVGAALRARDASRPTDEDLAEAEESLPIVRRNWLPREELPRR
ncbi:hypothetical protein [Actinoplanes flavus]|uniref:hypothetical protein n=1 Tax=Actinoplanes flavus TaxID=2820290 RepID=UPI003556D33A